ncbi:MAG: glycosyl hydrolase [Pusillimonas sp.]|nr:glycoside hydrolase family protein [Rhodanobacter sp. 115]TAM02358.1 MAG: glycosyl hydrolase [Pusillimonas sp.]
MSVTKVLGTLLTSSILVAAAGVAFDAEATPATVPAAAAARPWMNASLSPDVRADLVIKQLTLAEKVQLVHGTGWATLIPGNPIPKGWNYGAGYVPGIERLGIPGIHMDDSAVGVRGAANMSRYATLLPSTVGAAASWNPKAAFLYGAVIGRELRDQGFNMSIGGGVDLAREPRDGRTFEYAGEDPLLAGTMTGNLIKGVQSQHVMGDIKHYAFNDQETGRSYFNAVIGDRAAQESDLLAFRIGIDIGHPAGVMCAYNRVNGIYACENPWLLTQVLRKDIGFKGFVVSDWGGTHSTVASALAGLDMEMPGSLDGKSHFGAALEQAVQSGKVPMATLDEMDHRILRSMFMAGVVEHPVTPRRVVNPFEGRDDAEHIAEESIVLLRNKHHLLPLDAESVHSIAIIGAHADVGVLSGGGSAQVDAPGGNVIDPHAGGAKWGETVYFPSSPLKYIRQHAPHATVAFNSGADIAAAVALARSSQVAVVFAQQHMLEGMDRPTLALPDNQDALIEAVAAANPRTVVVLETGGPVTMPWVDRVQAVVEAWYPGIGGAQALANLLFGNVNFSAKLPVTFPRGEGQLPHPVVTGLTADVFHTELTDAQAKVEPFDVDYNKAGAAVGYKWFERQHLSPLFPFGFGLSYTTYAYSNLKVDADGKTATLTVTNTGRRAGTEIAEAYALLPKASGETYKRLVGFKRVSLAPGEAQTVAIPLNELCESIYGTQKHAFVRLPGTYTILAGPSSANTLLKVTFSVR